MWSKARPFDFADSIEVWRHTGELFKGESVFRTPVGHRFDKELTEQTRYWLGIRTERVTSDLRSLADSARP